MKLAIGSKNKIKVGAVESAVKLYPELFPNAEVVPMDVPIEEFGHPKSLDDTVKGAMERAKAAFVDCAYSFGIEGGLMAVPETKTGYMEVGVCAIFDGQNFHIGLSPAFEWPKQVFNFIMHGGLDGSQAVKAAGLTSDEKLGANKNGIIGVLTKDRVTRQSQTLNSIIMALVHLENRDLY